MPVTLSSDEIVAAHQRIREMLFVRLERARRKSQKLDGLDLDASQAYLQAATDLMAYTRLIQYTDLLAHQVLDLQQELQALVLEAEMEAGFTAPVQKKLVN